MFTLLIFDPDYFLSLPLFLAWDYFVLKYLYRKIMEFSRNYKQPLRREEAKILNKRLQLTKILLKGIAKNTYLYFIEFQLADGSIHEFSVPLKVYQAVKSGNTGTLSFRGSKFITFDN